MRVVRRRGPALLFAVLGFVLAPQAARPESSASGKLTVARLEATPPLDASLANAVWSGLTFNDGFRDLGTKSPVGGATAAAIAYDDTALYVAFRLIQSVPLTQTQATNDIGFGLDDFAGVGIDVSGNGERAYYFETTPRGTRYQQAAETSRYAPAWQAFTATTNDGWNALLVIPISALSLSSGGAQHWRLNFVRQIAATGQHESWAYDGLMPDAPSGQWPGFRESRWWPSAEGVMLKSAGVRRKPRFEPYALGGAGSGRNVYVDAAGNESERRERNVGLDLAVPLASTVTAVASLNPDFSNVEIDQQTIAPQQFQRNLIESRPFFAQGAQYINTGRENYEFNLPTDTLFYSPSIGPFDRGFKVEGTSGNKSFGVLETRGSDPTFDDLAYGFLHKRPNNTFALWSDGVVANLANGKDTALEVGAYGRSLASGLVYSLQYGREWGSAVTQTAQAQQLRGLFDIQRGGGWGSLESAVGYVNIGSQYNPAAGFTNIADVRGPNLFFDTTRNLAPGGLPKSLELYLYADRWLDRLGNVHLSDSDAFLTLRTTKNIRVAVGDSLSSQLTYGGNPYSGAYNGYADQVTLPYKFASVETVFGDGTPNSLDAYYQFGPFGGPYVNNFNLIGTKALPKNLSLALGYSGNLEHPLAGPLVSQWLRRVALGFPLGRTGNVSLSYRAINGIGGFAAPGQNLAASMHYKFRTGDELYVNWGAPAASSTLDRFIVKYVFRINGGLTS